MTSTFNTWIFSFLFDDHDTTLKKIIRLALYYSLLEEERKKQNCVLVVKNLHAKKKNALLKYN